MPEALAALEHAHLLQEWQDWLLLHRYAPLTVDQYVRTAKNLLASYPGVPIETITAEHIERHLAKTRLSTSSYLTRIECLRAFFGWLRKHKRLIRHNPCVSVDRPHHVVHPRPSVMPDGFARMCKAAPCLEALLVLHLGYYTGLRVNEMRHLKVGDVDVDRRLLRVRIGKGARRSGPRERWTPLHPETVRILQLWRWRALKLNPDLWLLGETRRQRSYKVVWAWVDACRKAAGLPEEITPHSLRHGFAKLMKLRGVSLEVTAAFMGHAGLEVTRRVYGQLSPEEMRGIYDDALGRRFTKDGEQHH